MKRFSASFLMLLLGFAAKAQETEQFPAGAGHFELLPRCIIRGAIPKFLTRAFVSFFLVQISAK